MLALTSTTSKLGSATLFAILEHNLIPTSQLVILTSSPLDSPKLATNKAKGIEHRSFDLESLNSEAFAGCSSLFLVSTPDIFLDFNNAALGGREKVHIAAIRAAISAGVEHVFYTSLAFASPSKKAVMRAHLRTEEFLHGSEVEGAGIKIMIIREGLYNESWPLYLGYYELKGKERDEILLTGSEEQKLAWTSIQDLGLGTALVLKTPGAWEGKTFYLSSKMGKRSMREVAELVGRARGRKLGVKIVGREEWVEHYVRSGKERAAVEWWVSSGEAVEDGECNVLDGTLDRLLDERGVKAKVVDDTISEAFGA